MKVAKLARSLRAITTLLAFDITRAIAHVEIIDNTIDIVLFKRLFYSVKEYSHELLHILLLKALTGVPAEAASETSCARVGQLSNLKRGKELLNLVQNTVLFGAINFRIVTIFKIIGYLTRYYVSERIILT